MQKLVIDIGNTVTKLGVFDGKELLCSRWYETIAPQDMEKIVEKYPSIEAAIVCTVAREPVFLAKSLSCFSHFIDWQSYRPDLKIPVKLRYEHPQTLGRDRIAVASAVASLYPGENVLCIVFGSCVTYNVVDSDACFLGGAISPGLNMRLRAMHRFTEALPLVDIRQARDTDCINNTQTALYSGALDGLRYEVDGYVERYRKRFPELRVVLTGGNAGYFEKSLNYQIFAHQNLVLRGLNEILDLNGKE
ncbi:MAG: type III pantothenate kinase [Bacteroidales bacterium]|nr:type III pantothenate kinase [Bacteroidales bacterium]MDE7072673.1 type III pantothenate kinase [Bacteroidales bacterium]